MAKHARVLSPEEFTTILGHVTAMRHPERNRVAVFLSHHAGLRVGEIASLRVGNVVDFAGRIRDALTLDRGNTKTKRARTVPVSPALREALAVYLATLGTVSPRSPLLFSQKGEGFNANTLCRWFMLAYRAAGIDASSHSGRRGFITTLHERQIGLKTIQELVGHAQLTTTQRYVDVTDDQKRQAVLVL